jgi:cobalt/nickel transport system permease protein
MISAMQAAAREAQFLETVRTRGLRVPRHGFVNATLRRLAVFFAASLLREEIARRPALLQRVHPRARLAATLLVLLSVSLASSLSALAAHALLVAGAVCLARIRVRELLGAGLLVAAAFSLLVALPAALNLTSGGRVLFPLLRLDGPWYLGPYTVPSVVGISGDGLRTAGTFLLRTLTSTAAVLCLALCTRWTDLLASLRSLCLPSLFVHTIGMTVRYLHLLLRQSEEVHLGKKSRTICRSPLASDQMWVGSRIAAAWEKSLHLMTDVSDAMTARGFTGDVRFAPGRAFGPADWTFLVLAAALCAVAQFS